MEAGKIKAAMYLRLSNEDSGKGKSEESNSISAQRVLLEKHIGELLRGRNTASRSSVMTGTLALTSAGRGAGID